MVLVGGLLTRNQDDSIMELTSIWDDFDSIVQNHDEDEKKIALLLKRNAPLFLYPVNLIIYLHFLMVGMY